MVSALSSSIQVRVTSPTRANPAPQVCVATVPMEKSGEVSAAYETDPSVRLKEGHSIAAMRMKTKNDQRIKKKSFNSKA